MNRLKRFLELAMTGEYPFSIYWHREYLLGIENKPRDKLFTLLPNREFIWFGRRYLNLLLPNLNLSSYEGRCQHDGCGKVGKYYLYPTYTDSEETKALFCLDHARSNGFCFACGQFYGGVESFDFGNGVCEDCHDQFTEEFDIQEPQDYEEYLENMCAGFYDED